MIPRPLHPLVRRARALPAASKNLARRLGRLVAWLWTTFDLDVVAGGAALLLLGGLALVYSAAVLGLAVRLFTIAAWGS